MSIVRSRRAGTLALVAATLMAAACGASPRAEREVAARNAAILRAGSAGYALVLLAALAGVAAVTAQFRIRPA